MPPLLRDQLLTADDLTAWIEKTSSRSAPSTKENPGNAFFTSSETRDRYSIPYNEHICLIDIAAFPEGEPIEELEYSKRTEFVPSEGNVFQLLLSKDEENLAITSAYALEALKTGAIKPDELQPSNDGPSPLGLGIVIGGGVAAARCAASAPCRAAVRKGVGAAAAWAGGNELWDQLRQRF